LHQGQIAEMRTGEGKTLAATLPVYLNALSGKGVHVVTVNDYLAKRDAKWMGEIYQFLGLTVGCITHGVKDEVRKEEYAADVIYGTNNEFGFDYLRDNMKFTREQMVQRPFHYAIIDEVDSILIDEARTPLIISGPTEDNIGLYVQVNGLISQLTEADYSVDEKARSITFSEEGNLHMEEILRKEGLLPEEASMYDLEHMSLVHHVNQALRAHRLFAADTDYIVRDGKVIIIDEFTGRMMEGRRFSEGLHQALEAKEEVPIQNENQTLASITFQNYFRMYPKLAGMTGTAMTEANEFADIYQLEVVEIPTNVTVIREDEDDTIYCTKEEKEQAIIEEIRAAHKKSQPVLVGTVSIEKSESLAAMLKKEKIPHYVLNAKYHEKEATIIAQAGRSKGVTIATNMAGRGTDIQLGGNEEMRIEEEAKDAKNGQKIEKIKKEVEQDKQTVIEAGGLLVMGTERHESRRIDNQLRGRSGRQGDPGRTKFFLSLEDDLMRIFGSERISGMLQKLGLKEGEAIYHPWITKALEKAQQKVEARNYEIRKNLLKYDDVMNDQRKVIYEQRIEIMEKEDVQDFIEGMLQDAIEEVVCNYIPEKSYPEEWDIEGLGKEIFHLGGFTMPVKEWAEEDGIAEEELITKIVDACQQHLQQKSEQYGEEIMRIVEKQILLMTLDQLWKDHLLSLDHLRQGINLRAYGQKDPLNEYKREAFMMFDAMLSELRRDVSARLLRVEIAKEPPPLLSPSSGETVEGRVDPAEMTEEPLRRVVPPEERNPNDPTSWGKIGRNEPCPCNSSKKYKHCHGAIG